MSILQGKIGAVESVSICIGILNKHIEGREKGCKEIWWVKKLLFTVSLVRDSLVASFVVIYYRTNAGLIIPKLRMIRT